MSSLQCCWCVCVWVCVYIHTYVFVCEQEEGQNKGELKKLTTFLILVKGGRGGVCVLCGAAVFRDLVTEYERKS